MILFLVLLKIAGFITWRQLIVIGLFEVLSIIWRKYNANKSV